ncbi:hypothetical protein GUITHDRAFT_153522, partial [Guillardia theta CCMP2712]
MFELLVKITDLHSAMEPAQTMGLNLTGEKNEVYDSMPTGGAPWAEHGYDMRATDVGRCSYAHLTITRVTKHPVELLLNPFIRMHHPPHSLCFHHCTDPLPPLISSTWR